MKNSKRIWKKSIILTLTGCLAFWLANFAISLTPIAAEYRAAMSIIYAPMLIQSLVGGLIIAAIVSFALLRFFDKLPTQNPIYKSVFLSLVVLIMVTVLIGGPSSFLATGDVLRYFVIGTIFNLIRILALGVGIGYLYRKLFNDFDRLARPLKTAQAK